MGKSVQEMREAVRRYYADGGQVPPEIQALPDPRVRQWRGTSAGGAETAYIKCDGKGLAPVAGTDTDGLKGKCPVCPGVVELTGAGMISAHLVGGINTPVSKSLKERQETVRVTGEGSRVMGNSAESAGFVRGYPGGAPLVRGRDMDGSVPVRRTRQEAESEGKRRTYAEAAGTMGGSTGRMHLASGILPGVVGGKHGSGLTEGEYAGLSRRQRQRENKRIAKAKDAQRAAQMRRREFERAHPELRARQGDGVTSARPYGSVPVGERTSQMWDTSKGGRTVETIARRSRERSPLDGMRIDAKPSGIKYRSEPVFGRTAGR
jgi:hypothetical protein